MFWAAQSDNGVDGDLVRVKRAFRSRLVFALLGSMRASLVAGFVLVVVLGMRVCCLLACLLP